MIIYPYKQFTPDIHPEAFIADNAVITGDVVIGEQSSIWFSAVIRGDVAPTRIGKRVSIHPSPLFTICRSQIFSMIVRGIIFVSSLYL